MLFKATEAGDNTSIKTSQNLDKVPKAKIVNAVYEPVVEGIMLALGTLYKGVTDDVIPK